MSTNYNKVMGCKPIYARNMAQSENLSYDIHPDVENFDDDDP